MGPTRKTEATLRFGGDDLQPDEVTAILGAPPDHAVAKGGTWRTPRGTEQIGRTGIWFRRAASRTPGDLDAQIAELLAPLTTDLAAWRALAARFDGNVFCGLFSHEMNSGLTLAPATLHALAVRGLALGLDIYAFPPAEAGGVTRSS